MFDTVFDLGIIGAGPAGSAAAIRAAHAGKSVLLLDRCDFTKSRPGEHLSGAALGPLAEIGWHPEDHPKIAAPVTTLLSSWFGDVVLQKQALQDPYGLGYSIERPAFEKSLHQLAIDAGVTVLQKTRFLGMQVTGNLATLSIGTDSKKAAVKARFVLDASGPSRVLSKGEPRVVDQLICFHFNAVFNSENHDPLCLAVEAQKNGWWYSLERPFARETRWQTNVGFFCDPEVFKASKSDALTWVKNNLEHSHLIGTRIDRNSISDLRIYPTGSVINSTTKGHLWKSIGDAEQIFDPLSQLGLLKSLMKDQSDALSVEHYLGQRAFIYSQKHNHSKQAFWQNRREFDVL